MRLVVCTGFALIAFALNSILCRLALRGDEADAAAFTAVRLAAGALVLGAIVSYGSRNGASSARRKVGGRWISALFLFAYAILFSLAYLNLAAGTGALILFGSVQFTMIMASLVRGERSGAIEWLGLAVALFGLIYLFYPGLSSPPPGSSALMAGAGMFWGLYTLRGKRSADPIGETAGNFLKSLPFGAAALLVFLPSLNLSAYGVLLAVISGAVTSGIGYAVWYAALRDLTTTRAAVVQLAVPIITAIIGIVFLGEIADLRLVISGMLILGGIALTVFGRRSN
ncbi:MAG: DMT family transporter [Blastocatellia bacterium]|nr:DMT family transporter [Blastocatellia bacterium]